MAIAGLNLKCPPLTFNEVEVSRRISLEGVLHGIRAAQLPVGLVAQGRAEPIFGGAGSGRFGSGVRDRARHGLRLFACEQPRGKRLMLCHGDRGRGRLCDRSLGFGRLGQRSGERGCFTLRRFRVLRLDRRFHLGLHDRIHLKALCCSLNLGWRQAAER